MKKISSPCYQCVDREVGCHSKCEKYLIYKRTNEEVTRLEKEAKSKIFHSYSASVEKRVNKRKEV